MKKILVISNTTGSAGMNCLLGIFDQINESHYDWDVRLMQSKGEIPASFLSNAVSEGASGIIASIGVPNELTDALSEVAIPIVIIHSELRDTSGVSRLEVKLRNDNYAVGKVAAQHLLERGSFRSYAFVPTDDPTPWSDNRQRGFLETLVNSGVSSGFVIPRTENLTEQLKRAAKPLAVLGATDLEASNVIAACHNLKLDVPEQVAVLGVDDSEVFCNSVRPTLSSVHTDDRKLGRTAALQLNNLLRSRHRRGPTKTILIPPSGVTMRDSTRKIPPAGHLIRNALAYIQSNFESGIDVADVVRHLGVSESLARKRFRTIHGKSIRDVIIELRLEKAKQLLRTTNEPMSRIAESCGFSSACRLAHLFKDQTGLSMRDYRTDRNRQLA